MKPSPIEELLIKIQTENCNSEFKICFYQIFIGMNLNNTLHIKGKWKAEMNLDISQDMWEEIYTEAHSVTNSNMARIQMEGNHEIFPNTRNYS